MHRTALTLVLMAKPVLLLGKKGRREMSVLFLLKRLLVAIRGGWALVQHCSNNPLRKLLHGPS